MVTQEALQDCFLEAGRRYGYDDVMAEFAQYRDFKVRWQRSYRWARFKVSDYLEDAPEKVVRDLAQSLFRRIVGDGYDGYTENVRAWVTSEGFREAKQQIYLRRSRSLTRSPVGDHRNIRDAYESLIAQGLVDNDPEIYLSWSKDTDPGNVVRCSVLMKVVALSSLLDGKDVPGCVVEYCLYHELCHIAIGFDPTSEKHERSYDELEKRYPRRAEARQWMARHCLRIRGVSPRR